MNLVSLDRSECVWDPEAARAARSPLGWISVGERQGGAAGP